MPDHSEIRAHESPVYAALIFSAAGLPSSIAYSIPPQFHPPSGLRSGCSASPSSRACLKLQPAFERGSHFANDARIKLSGSFADEFGELHRLDALDVDVA